jgi:hypothetical protein
MRRLVPLLMMLFAGWWFWPAPFDDPVDRTRISSGVTRMAPVVLQLAYTDVDGRTARVLVDAERYSAFVQRSVVVLEDHRVALGGALAERVAARTAPAFDTMATAVPGFVDWYLGPTTGVKLVLAAGSSWRPGVRADAAARAVVLQRYRTDVLQPERHDAGLRAAFVDLLAEVARERDAALAAIDRDFLAFVAAERRRGVAGKPVVELDWRSQARRLDLPVPAGPAATPMRDEMAARLAGPAVGVVIAAGVGAGAGATLGWYAAPIAAVIGAGAAVVADRAIANWRRTDIEREVFAALAATREDWSGRMSAALSEAVDVWFDDAIQSLPRFDQNGRRALSAAISVPSSK